VAIFLALAAFGLVAFAAAAVWNRFCSESQCAAGVVAGAAAVAGAVVAAGVVAPKAAGVRTTAAVTAVMILRIVMVVLLGLCGDSSIRVLPDGCHETARM
jgi:hypothetical protein